jgi:hypothetical protein
LSLSASATPVPDLVALVATLNNDGIVSIPGANGTGVFSVASANVGAGGAITVTVDLGAGTLPVNIALCRTNPSTGQCVGEIGPGVTMQVESGQTTSFAVFVTGAATIPFDPAAHRVFVRFKDAAGVSRGATSVAVRTN